ncbi:efflux RND transporter periplasmic adaptor subunit [Parasphingorhabdus sp.]|uniref:efflux RND transporter periplasmic adaptor subunit n=1 Tax=Parasphingorhabdus sp. TaxID=2709688 RepID=UPI003D2732CE
MLKSITERLRGVSFVRTILPIMAIIAIIVTAFIVLSGQPDRSEEEPEISPPKATAAFGNADSVAGSGLVEPSSEVIDIGTSLAGIVTKVFVTPGDQVNAGAPLFLVDDRAIRAQIQEATASIARAKAARDTARALLATARQQSALYSGIEDERAVSKQEVIDRSGAVRTARAQLAQAEAEIRSADAARARATTDLNRLTVRAPITAEILSVNIRPGEYANPGGQQGGGSEPYMEIGTTDPLHIRIDIDENEIGRVQLGTDVVISPRGEANRRIQAQFVRAEPLVTPKTSLTNAATERVDVRVLQLIYRIPADQGLFVGQQVDAFVRAKTGENFSAEQAGDSQ